MSRDELRRAATLKKQKIRRRNRFIAGAAMLLLIVVIGIILSLTVFFHIEKIDITGDEIYNAEQIIGASGISLGSNMFLTDMKEARASVEKSLPYVESAEIKRSLSGTIEIRVTKATAAYAVEDAAGYTLLSKNGKVLEDAVQALNDGVTILYAGNIKNLPLGAAAEFENEKTLELLTSLDASLRAHEITGITEMDLSDPLNIKLRYLDTITLLMGQSSTVEGKLDFAKATLEKTLKDNPFFTGTVDMTVEKKAYFRADKETDETKTEPPQSTTVPEPQTQTTQTN